MKSFFVKNIIKYCPQWMTRSLRKHIKIKPEQMQGFQFRIARDIADLEEAYRLVHNEYVRCGYMDPSDTGMRFGLHNFLPETTTFIATFEDRLALTITIFQDTELGLPMDALYKRKIDRLRAAGRKVAEVGALATHPDFRNGNQNLPLYGDKIAYSYARDNLGIEDLVLAINPKHEWIYKHILLLDKIGRRKHYDYVKGADAVGYRMDLSKFENNLQKRYSTLPQESNLHAFFAYQHCENIELPEKGVSCVWDTNTVSHFLSMVPTSPSSSMADKPENPNLNNVGTPPVVLDPENLTMLTNQAIDIPKLSPRYR
jgi:hypothetical protein